MSFREIGVALANDKIISFSVGLKGSVEFSWDDIKKEWDEERFNILYLVHSHPEGFRYPSSIDDNMLCGWAKAFNVPVVSIIVTDLDAIAYLFIQHDKAIVKLILGTLENDLMTKSILRASYSTDDRYLWEIKMAKDLKSRVTIKINKLYIWRMYEN